MKVKLVTGYVPIPNHPRTAADYDRLGAQLAEVDAPRHKFTTPLQNCWLYHEMALLPFKPTHSIDDNPAKNSLAYHIVQHQKFEWLLSASILDKETDVFVWIDYGIFHMPSVSVAVIRDFFGRLKDNDLAIPGVLPEPTKITDENVPCWRFCGSLLVVPRAQAAPLYNAIKSNALRHIAETKNVSWEVNTLARVEMESKLPIRWYPASWNLTLFTNYMDANGS
jgi:hypothetical protein